MEFARGLGDTELARARFGHVPSNRTSGAADGRRSEVPTTLTPLIGRAEDIRSIQELFSRREVRLLTLTGPPGIGKTRLALEVAHEAIDRFRDGVFFVGLASTLDPDLVLTAIARTLGMNDKSGESLMGKLRQALGSKQMLLALDNFEQVLDAGPLLLELLSACPDLKIMITSREALYVHGEQQFSVPALATADPANLPPLEDMDDIPSVALFIDRAQSVKPDFNLTEQNAGAIAAICVRLGGLPLAIELAAARIRIFSPQEMLVRLESRSPLLTGGPRNLPARQQTLRAAIDWSYNLLNKEEKALFARLGVFLVGSRSLRQGRWARPMARNRANGMYKGECNRYWIRTC